MITWLILQLPTWNMIRFFGLLAFSGLTLGLSLGIIQSMPLKGKIKAKLFKGHTFFVGFGLISGILHAMLLSVDTYLPYTWKEILIPFYAHNKPVWSGLGTLTLYGMLILIFTSDIRNVLGKKVWHTIHLSAYFFFILALFHGIYNGTDTKLQWVRDLYSSSAGLVAFLTLLRILVGGKKQKKTITQRQRNNAVS